MILHAMVMRPLTKHPYQVETEYAGFLPDQTRDQGAKRRDLFAFYKDCSAGSVLVILHLEGSLQ